MITSVNNLNAEEYRVLFAKATEALMNYKEDGKSNNGDYHFTGFGEDVVKEIPGGEFGVGSNPEYEKDIFFVLDGEKFVLSTEEEADPQKNYYQAPDISSLNAYFSNIEALAQIDEKFVMLPLTEELFEINANTREITVPKHFKENGISVQGDEISEILYFKIDRYFDAQDLHDPEMQIYIQWKSAAVGDNKQPIEGVSQAFCVKEDIAPNYVIFGWPISSIITQAAGEISFAVRFFKYNTVTNHIDYSLSTLTQKVNIKPALDLDIYKAVKNAADPNFFIDDSTDLVINRLKNTRYNDASVQAGEPYFIVNFNPSGATAEEIAAATDPLTGNVELEAWLDKNTDFAPTKVKVQANGDGTISYNWSYVAPVGPNGTDKTFPSSGTNVFYKTTDDHRWDGTVEGEPVKTYYIIENPNETFNPESDKYYGTCVAYTGNIFDPEAEGYPENGIWERFSEFEIKSIGKYYVTVTNRVQNNRVYAKSYEIIINRPAEPQITNELPAQVALDNNGYQELSVIATSSDSEKSKFTYQWQIFDKENNEWVNVPEDEVEPTNNGKSATYKIKDSIGLGNYRVIVTNNLNRLSDENGNPGEIATNSINSSSIRVTHKASLPTVQILDAGATIQQGDAFRILIAANPEEERMPEDKIEVSWYKYLGGNQEDEFDMSADLENIANGTYQIGEYDSLVQEASLITDIGEEGTGSKFYPSAAGSYFCVVTNTYNGSKISRTCGMFNAYGNN